MYRRLSDLVDNLGRAEAASELLLALDNLLTTTGCAHRTGGKGGASAFGHLAEGMARARSQSGGGASNIPDVDLAWGDRKHGDVLESSGHHDAMLLVRG